MLHNWYAPGLSSLTDRLIANDRASRGAPASALFASPLIVVHNHNVETYLKFEIARRTGIAAGLRFCFLEELLSETLAGLSTPGSLLHRHELHVLLLGLLEDEQLLEDEALAAVREYLDVVKNSEARARRCHQLAGRLASLFEEYSLSRPELLDSWATDTVSQQSADRSKAATWQRFLWKKIFACGGIRDGLCRDQGRRLLRLEEYAGVVGELESVTIHQAHLFGFAYISRTHLTALAALGQKMEIHLYTPVPGKRFLVWSSQAGSSNTHPLLEQWGKPGLEYAEQLQATIPASFHCEVEIAATADASLLGKLQQDIITGSVSPDPRGTDDGSLQFLACPDVRREVEIIGNEIWALINESAARDEKPTLRFNEIAVIIADSGRRDAYQTHLRAAFGELHEIPFAMADTPAIHAGRIVVSVQKLLALPVGRFTRSELLGVLTEPAILPRHPEARPEEWKSWCEQTGIFYGADKSDNDATYVEKDLLNWDQGLRRVVLGCFMAGQRTGEERVFELGGDAYLPQEYAEDSTASAALFVTLARSLIADARFAREARLTLAEWARFFSMFVRSYFAGETPEEDLMLGRCLGAIAQLHKIDLDSRPVSYGIAHEFVSQNLSALTIGRGHYLADGVCVSSFLPMRELPFRVIFICGLGEGCFPAPEREDLLDQRAGHAQKGDVTERERDKYVFLSTLLAAQERLYLTYVSRDSLTGELLEPSSVVLELQYVLRKHYVTSGKLDALCKAHPLRRYDSLYFPESRDRQAAAWASFSGRAAEEAAACRLRERLRVVYPEGLNGHSALRGLPPAVCNWLGLIPLPDGQAPAGVTDSISLSLSALRRFLECPLQGWATTRLRLRVDDEEDPLLIADENFSLPSLHRTVLLREVFLDATRRSINQPDFATAYDIRADLLEHRSVLPTGLFSEFERLKNLEVLRNWHEKALEAGLNAPLEVIRFGRAEQDEPVDRLEAPLVFEMEVPDSLGMAQAIRVEIHGRTEMLHADGAMSLTLVTNSAAKKKYHLRGFLDYVVMVGRGGKTPTAYRSCVISTGAKANSREYVPLSEREARDYLGTLVRDLLGSTHHYFLPCEAVFDLQKAGQERTLEDIAQGYQEDPNKTCSSLYGPVPVPLTYPPPEEAAAQLLIERRFGLFLRIPGGSDHEEG